MATSLRPQFRLALPWIICCTLWSCADGEAPSDIADETVEPEVQDEAPIDGAPIDGWRRGRASVELQFSYAVSAEERKAESTKTVIYEALVSTQTAMPVWLPPHFQWRAPETDDEELLHSFYESEIVITDNGEPLVFSPETSEARTAMRLRSNDPRSNDTVLLEHEVEQQGVVEQLRISGIKPSLFGEGYQMTVNITVNLSGSDHQVVVYAGGARSEHREAINTPESIDMQLLPTPYADQPRHLPSWQWSALSDDQFIASAREQFVDLFRGVQRAHAQNPQHNPRTDLITRLDDGALVLHYRAVAERNLPLLGDPLWMSYPATNNDFSLTLRLEPGR